MMNDFLFAVLGCLVYGLLFGQREEAIRSYLRRQRHGVVRRLYVAAFVGAVRGRAVATDTRLLGYLVLLVPLIFSFWLLREAAVSQTEIKVSQTEINRLESSLENQERASKGDSDLRSPEKQLASVTRELDSLKKESERLASDPLFRYMRLMSRLALVIFYVGLFVWHPFIVMCRRFAYEVDRFTLRIQGLASKSELAELAVAESKVNDETSLRKFVETTKGVAIRHNVLELVATFDLW